MEAKFFIIHIKILFLIKTTFEWSLYFLVEAFTLSAHEFGVSSSIYESLLAYN